MTERFAIAGYARISVDEELNRDNTSIENQKAIISDFVKQHFPNSSLTFYEDRDRSGYTFEQRESYQVMRQELMTHRRDILIVKDFSRFSRRNSRGLVELEDLRDAGVRIISIGDGIDFPNDDDWLKIQFQFLINEMPVTDTSKKVRSVIKRRQADGRWICASPYGYIVGRQQQFEPVPAEADIVRRIYQLYMQGWGYKKIANLLTEEGIPTPRMTERERKESIGEAYHRRVKPVWSIVTVQGILDNDFYIGTLRQGKYARSRINGRDVKRAEHEHIVIEHHHPAILDACTFAAVRALRERRSTTHYRGIRKNDNAYAGFLFCGDCGSPMFAMNRGDMAPAYRCGEYHRRGLKGCTSHHIRADKLDELMKGYVRRVKAHAAAMIDCFNRDIAKDTEDIAPVEQSAAHWQGMLTALQEELKATKRQRIRDIMKHPEQEDALDATYGELEDDLLRRMAGIRHQLDMSLDQRNTLLSVNRAAKTAMDVFDDILQKDKLERRDVELMLQRINVYENHIEIHLKADVDSILSGSASPNVPCALSPIAPEDTGHCKLGSSSSEQPIQLTAHQEDKAFPVHVVSDGDPLEIYTDKDGEVILKKYSPIGEISNFAKDYTESLFRSLGHIACITDKDMIVSASGVSRKELWEKPISRDLEQAIQSRQVVTANRGSGTRLVPVTNEDDAQAYTAQVICPIIADGESIGAVVLLSREPAAKMGDMELKVAETTASIVGRQMEQ